MAKTTKPMQKPAKAYDVEAALKDPSPPKVMAKPTIVIQANRVERV